jgi:hypothetical protein
MKMQREANKYTTGGLKSDLFLRGRKDLSRRLRDGVDSSLHFGGEKNSMYISHPQPGNTDSGVF